MVDPATAREELLARLLVERFGTTPGHQVDRSGEHRSATPETATAEQEG